MENIHVKAFWDEEALVWVATSDDVPGLVTEAATSEELIKKLQIMVPELLQANGLMSDCTELDIPLHIFSERTETIKCRPC